MQLPGSELFLESLIDALLPLDTIFAAELGTDDQRLEMLSIAVQGEMFAGHAGEETGDGGVQGGELCSWVPFSSACVSNPLPG